MYYEFIKQANIHPTVWYQSTVALPIEPIYAAPSEFNLQCELVLKYEIDMDSQGFLKEVYINSKPIQKNNLIPRFDTNRGLKYNPLTQRLMSCTFHGYA